MVFAHRSRSLRIPSTMYSVASDPVESNAIGVEHQNRPGERAPKNPPRVSHSLDLTSVDISLERQSEQAHAVSSILGNLVTAGL